MNTLLLLTALTLAADDHADLADFLSRITSTDDAVRLAARFEAPAIGAPAVVALGGLLTDDSVNVRVAARAALELIVHHAGRPGGVEERGDVCAELRKLLAADRPVDTRREAVFLLGYIAGDRSVPAIARLLGDADRHVAETARLSLERIPGSAAVEALVEALDGAGDELAPSLLYSLSKKGGERVVEVLSKHAREGSPEARLAALGGLARLGVRAAIPLFEAAIEKPDGIAVNALYRKYLLLGDVLSERVDRETAVALFRRALAKAPDGYLREHALLGVCPPGSLENVDVLIEALADPSIRVRRVAQRQLAALEGGEVLEKLTGAYRSVAREARPALLRTLAERDRDATTQLLADAAESPDAALRITALDILDRLEQPELEATYFELAEKGHETIRPTAVKGYLALARKRLEDGDGSGAFEMCGRVLESLPAATDHQRMIALRGVVESGDRRGLEILPRYFRDSLLANEAARGVIELARALGEAGEKEEAARRLQTVVAGQFPREIIQLAVDRMKQLGFDPQGKLKEQGFVVEWMLTTPIRNPDDEGFTRAYFPEERLAAGREMGFREVHSIGPRRVRWRKLDTLSPDGRINLLPLFRRSENVLIYAYTELHSNSDREVLLKMASDEGIICWLGKERIHTSRGPRGLKIDQDVVEATLGKGTNRLLLKITQGGGDWAFALRVTDREGKPIDTSTLESGS